jgi:hypothetical protein
LVALAFLLINIYVGYDEIIKIVIIYGLLR